MDFRVLSPLWSAIDRACGWRTAATAPYNQELELRVVEAGAVQGLPYPCLQNNEGQWINVDLGTELSIQPLQWRPWRQNRSPQPHHERINLTQKPPLHPELQRVKPRRWRDGRD